MSAVELALVRGTVAAVAEAFAIVRVTVWDGDGPVWVNCGASASATVRRAQTLHSTLSMARVRLSMQNDCKEFYALINSVRRPFLSTFLLHSLLWYGPQVMGAVDCMSHNKVELLVKFILDTHLVVSIENAKSYKNWRLSCNLIGRHGNWSPT